MGRVEGKVALITGAARGQGRSHAIALAREGADIIAVDLFEQIDEVPYPMAVKEDLATTVREVEALGRRIVAREADVRDLEALAAVVGEGVAELGRLDIVCANAGITGPYAPAASAADRVRIFRAVVDVNLTGVYITIEASKQAIIDGGNGGSIIITSSLAGLRTLGAGGGYTEAKHGLVGLMRGAAHELAPHLIRVNSIHPSNVATPMIINEMAFRTIRPDKEAPTQDDLGEVLGLMNLMPVPFLESSDISNAVLFLASDESRYITGVTLPLDAGAAIK
ncbi:mycofactocin-coupled SDR family oxidoreductase [Frankia sp. CNm7]|uniref:Mycofactocin-coupled SDR family oxidoreductase n=1 Tax=Frankia nepalensis TaxID=1836974 RepID=A0A937RK24_9ACTN|nr:mycofactocin-coupled SDR family oxidoreductase [Frankia nepalensis]MBL7496632.1 mycofactocin-coupled SDR family oxidoreductase [Frankia nepalensis]MBL7511890.1 mycofactocin-coupled SDR family oxidoreductase [Frankia nepalensis]MBL7516641.1 mycofactocin-coupled SDR family oxidoreductase [Frankia nepalensis]MBL7627371.1 mycofactocin-coupled SDR family oxidoreductase [Frankia nepalensis]